MRKTPKQARAWHTLQAIFDATLQVLERHGEARLTTARIAERAGCSVGTLYQYFPDKDALLLAMIDLETERVMAELAQLLQDGVTRGEPAQALIRPYIGLLIERFALGGPGRQALLKRAWRLDHRPEVRARIQLGSARISQALAARADPHMPPPDAETLFILSRTVLGAIRSAVLEDHPELGQPAFEARLVALAERMLRQPALGDGG